MDILRAMRVFRAVAEEHSFSSASRKLGLAVSAVTRTVNALEEHLGVVLLIRSTRQIRLTTAGERYLESCRYLLHEVDTAHAEFTDEASTLKGSIRLTAPRHFGQSFVQPFVLDFMDQNPEIHVSARYSDLVQDVMGEHLDVAIRIGELTDSPLTAVRLGWICRVICAAPEYLDGRPEIDTPFALRHHRIVAATSRHGRVEWAFDHDTEGRLVFQPDLAVNESGSAIAAALKGWGITRAHSYAVAPHLAKGELVRLLKPYEPLSLPIHLLHPYGRKPPLRIRRFIDDLVANLRARPELQFDKISRGAG
jgi:DNA-binding transcriptional LysR family regulator